MPLTQGYGHCLSGVWQLPGSVRFGAFRPPISVGAQPPRGVGRAVFIGFRLRRMGGCLEPHAVQIHTTRDTPQPHLDSSCPAFALHRVAQCRWGVLTGTQRLAIRRRFSPFHRIIAKHNKNMNSFA